MASSSASSLPAGPNRGVTVTPQITVVINWTEKLKQRVPTR